MLIDASSERLPSRSRSDSVSERYDDVSCCCRNCSDCAAMLRESRRCRNSSSSSTMTTTKCSFAAATAATYVAFLVLNRLMIVVDAFNLDTRIPIVKDGVVGSYFGYSVAQHYVFNPRSGDGDPTVLVGAPRDNVTDSSAPSEVRQLVRPGSVYRCPFTSRTDDCAAIKLNQEKPSSGMDKNDQWLGVTVVSQGTETGRALACGHRYKTYGSSYRWGLGICVSMTNALDEDLFWEPCDGKPKTRGHGDYGFCQAGTSAAVDKDGDVILGAPGPVNWRGTIFKNSMNMSLEAGTEEWINSPVEDVLPGLEGIQPEPASGFYSYLGMSVKIGHILNGKKTYVVGAPRSKNTGQVFLMQLTSNGIVVRQNLTGEQFGSSFGYDIAIADVNNDRKEDLIVGAPFYHQHGIGGAIYVFLNGPTGIVASRNQTIYSRELKDKECQQLDCQNARFGFSLAAAGDLDGDGYNDIIVGAPYEGPGAIYIYRGSARGLIQNYSQRIFAAELPHPTARPLKAFGQSLTSGMDMDSNGYPDIVVGAFGSDQIVMLRTRPVVNVETTLTSTPPRIDLLRSSTSNELRCADRALNATYCFEVKVCFEFTVKLHQRFQGPAYVSYKLEGDIVRGVRGPRVSFKGSLKQDDKSYIEMDVTLQKQGNPSCHRHTVFINPKVYDFLNPIRFRLTQKLRESAPPTMTSAAKPPDISRYPVLNASLAENHLSVEFVKNCGRDSECVSSLAVNASLGLPMDRITKEYILRVDHGSEFRLIIYVNNTAEEAHEATVYVELPPSLNYRGTDDLGKQYSCNTIDNSTTVLCAIGNPMEHGKTVKFGIRLVPNITAIEEKLTVTVRVNTTSKELDPRDNVAVVRMKAIIEANLIVQGTSYPQEVMYSGTPIGTSGMRSEADIGLEIFHIYEVENERDSGPVAASKLHISWPYANADGQYLLYLVDEPRVSDFSKIKCSFPANAINPEELARLPSNASAASSTDPYTKASRRKPSRSTADDDISSSLSQRRRSKRESAASTAAVFNSRHLIFDCASPSTTKCHEIVCSIGELKGGEYAVIQLRARVWNSTYLEKYTDYDRVLVSSRAEVKIDPRLNIRQTNTSDDVVEATTKVIPDIQVQRPLGLPLWIIIVIIIVAIIIGIFLLCLIMLLLWKCGFFKRYKPTDDLAMQKAKLEKHPNSYSDYD